MSITNPPLLLLLLLLLCRAAKLAIREEIMREMERARLRAEAGDAMEEDTNEEDEVVAEILPR